MKSSLSHMLSRAGLAATFLATTLSFGALAAYAQTPTGLRVIPGQLVIRVPAGTTATDVSQMADAAGCLVVRPLAFTNQYYVLRLKSAGRAAPVIAPRAIGTGPLSRAEDTFAVGPLTQDMRDAITALRANSGVLAGPDIVHQLAQAPTQITPNDPYYAGNGFQRWDMDMIRMPEAWSIQVGTRTVKAVIADSGMDTGHPDFLGADGKTSRIVLSRNFISTDPTDFKDANGHGTHVGGTVGATTNNGVGVVGIAGWSRGGVDVQLLNARVANAAGAVSGSGAIESFAWATSNTADVINCSFGSDGIKDADVPLFDVEGAAVADMLKSGVTMVASAGNATQNGSLADMHAFPADFPGVIKVSSIGPTRAIASYSNYGGPVAIGAPGGDINQFGASGGIWSTWPTYLVAGDPAATNYNLEQGTSMAAPHVTGVAALVLAAGAPRDPALIKKIIQETATPLDETPNFAGGNKFGAGLLNAYGAEKEAVEVYADPAPSLLGVAVPADKKSSYYTTFQQVGASVTFSGVNKFLNPTDPANKPSVLTIELRTATEPSRLVASYTYSTANGGARDFDIAALQTGELAGTARRTITVPPAGAGQVPLDQGSYQVVATLTYNGTAQTQSDIFDVNRRVQPAGRTMFALPFRVRQVDAANPERTVLGPSGFTLWRYDATGASTSDTGTLDASGDYVAFKTTPGSPDNSTIAGFAAGSTGTPLTFLQSDAATSIAPVGIGYWLDLTENRTITAVGTSVTTEPVAIRLYAGRSGGWNMIGAPFDFPVDWSGVLVQASTNLGAHQYTLAEAVTNGIISSVLVGYDQNQGYVYSVAPFGQVQPFNGYWVQARQDCILFFPPNRSQVTTTRGVKGTTPKMTGSLVPAIEGWRVRMTASAAGDVDGQNFFGQAKGASEQEDKLDVPKPPAGAGHAYLRFVADQSAGHKAAYAFDMRPVSGVKSQWSAAVSTDKADTDVTLAWDGMSNLPRRSRLVLTDTVTGQQIAMDSRSSYTFHAGEAGSTRMFKVELRSSASGGPLQIMNLSTSRTTGRGVGTAGLSVRFTTNQDADVTASVRTLSGQLVAELGGTSRAVGMKETVLTWIPGRAQNGSSSVPVGPLVVELRARSADGEVTTVKRPIQLLR